MQGPAEAPDDFEEFEDIPEETPWITLKPNESISDVLGSYTADAEAELGFPSFDMLHPGPLPDTIAGSFAGGRYTRVEIGPEGWSLPSARVYGGTSNAVGYNGTFINPTPQVGGIQSLIDNAILPEWGNTAENTASVFLPPGTVVYIGISSSQGGFYIGGNIQIYVPK